MITPKDYSELLTSILDIDNEPVGIKFIEEPDEFKMIDVFYPDFKMKYCAVVKLASKGKSFKITSRNLGCVGSSNVLGLNSPSEIFESGKSGISLGLYKNIDISKKSASQLSKISKKHFGIQIMPLKNFDSNPDSLILISQSYNIMRLVQGFSYHYGPIKKCSVSGNQALCSELTAEPIQNGAVNFSFLCSGTRFWCKWNKNEMGIGINYRIFPEVMDGLVNTLNPTETKDEKLKIIEKLNSDKIGSMKINTQKSYFYTFP